MALKDRLQARKQGDGRQLDERGLSVLEGTRPEPVAEPVPAPKPAVSKPAGPSPAFAAAKTAIYTQLIEMHADEVDITDRPGVRKRIEILTDDYIRTSGATLNRLDYGHLVDSLLDDVLGLGPLQQLLEDRRSPRS